jgi:hypothetical protein
MKPYGCFYGGEIPDNGVGNVDIGFLAVKDIPQSVSSGVSTLLTFDSKLPDESPVGSFNLATNKYTVPQEGRYIFTIGSELSVAARGSGYLELWIDFGAGPIYKGSQSDESSVASGMALCYSLVHWVKAGDIVEARLFQNSGFNVNVIACSTYFAGAAIFAK